MLLADLDTCIGGFSKEKAQMELCWKHSCATNFFPLKIIKRNVGLFLLNYDVFP